MYLLSPLWMIVTARQAIKRKGGWRFFSTRLGWRTQSKPAIKKQHTTKPTATQPLWIHAASVGEVKAILPLIIHIQKTWPTLPVHVTCTTPESLGLLEKSRVGNMSCDYCPIDFFGSTITLFKRLNPLALLIVETEMWPNLYSSANRYNAPLVIINGRASKKTMGAPAFVLSIYRQILQHVSLVLSRSEADSTNFHQLGLSTHRIKTVGNIKTYTGDTSQHTALPELSDKLYILAASTHDPEEQLLCDALLNTVLMQTGMLLVIAPRHVQRSLSIQHMLTAKDIVSATRSRHDPVTEKTQVYLADTTGEMDNLIANAVLVFVGGSLIERGGHNVLEPAAQGKPVVTGPHYKNFKDEVALLSHHNAIKIINDANELATVCTAVVNQPDSLDDMGNAARTAIKSSKHIFEQYTAEIDTLIRQLR